MSVLNRFKLAQLLGYAAFWLPIIVVYFEQKGISLTEVYGIISVYSLCIVLFEYPTGVIGDYYSHKTSTLLGYLAIGISMLFTLLAANYWLIMVAMVLGSLGMTLKSGSDAALLYDLSDNYKHDAADVKSKATIVTIISFILGSFAYTYSPDLPMLLTSIAFFAGALLLITIPNPRVHVETTEATSNIFSQSWLGFKTILKTKSLVYGISILSLVSAFFISYKWFYNPLFAEMNIPEIWWGFLVSGFSLVTAVGIKVSTKFSLNTLLPIIFLTGIFIAASGFTAIPIIGLMGMLLAFIGRGFIETKLDVYITENAPSQSRAATLSLQSLISRLISAGYLFVLGLLSINLSFFLILAGTAGVIVILTVLLRSFVKFDQT